MYTSSFQPQIRWKQLGNWPNTCAKRLQKLANRTLAKRLVGETFEFDDDHGEDDGYGDNDDDDDDDNKWYWRCKVM